MKTLTIPVIARNEMTRQSNLFKIISRLFSVFGLLLLLAVSGWGETPDVGNTCGAATTISIDSTTSSLAITPDTDIDYFKIVLTEAGTLDLSSTGATKDTIGRLYNSACTQIVSDTGNNNFSISRSLSAGTYYVSVEDQDGETLTYSLVSAFALPNPEIRIRGNGTTINDGDTSPSTADDTDFGSTATGSGIIDKTFTIRNTDNNDILTIGAITFNGANASDFTVLTAPAASVAANDGETTFTIRFIPSAEGVRNAAISIVNNDQNENPYDFSIRGTGLAPAPDINVVGIADGGTDTSFGSTDVVGGTLTKTYTIQNTGPGALTIGAITFSGTNSGDFTVTTSPVSPVAATTGSTTFIVTFNPSGAGTRTAILSIASNDPDSENPYTFTISGTGIAAPTAPTKILDVPDLSLNVGTAMTALDLDTYFTDANGDAITYTISPSLPAGLNYDSTTHIISGTPTTVMSLTNFTVTAADNITGSVYDIFSITVTSAPIIASGYTDFSLRKQLYAKGNMKTIGNTVLVAPRDSGTTGSASSDNDASNCSTYTNGAFIVDATDTNDAYFLCGYSVDGTQTNATTSELVLPSASSKILWAGLYWQALVDDASWNTNMTIKMRRDENGTGYTNLQPDVLRYTDNTTVDNHKSYSAFKDMTATFLAQGWGAGHYTVGNIPIREGKISNLGTYGAWSLVVIYEDTTSAAAEKFRSFSVFDGWKRVSGSVDANITVSGFYTPNRLLPASAAKVSVFTAEGDKNIVGDQLKTFNYIPATPTEVILPAASTNTFKSLVTGGAGRTPEATNNQGIDIQTFDIGNLLKPKQTDMNFLMTSDGDVYWPSMIAFSTELVAPQLCYDYSFKQDGSYLKADNNGTQLPLLTGFINDSPIEASIYLRNNEADIKAQGLSFYAADINATMFQYADNSIATSNVNGSVLLSRTETDSGGCSYTDGTTSPIGCTRTNTNPLLVRMGIGRDATGYSQTGGGNLGQNEYVYAKFAVDPITAGIQDVNQSLGLRLQYYIIPKTGAAAIPYDYEFGTDIAMCPAATGYTPTWGIFNVVDRSASTYTASPGSYTLPVNNLRTQISRTPFNVDVAMYEKNTDTKYTKKPSGDTNTTVLVEIIDNDAFHDANASCANPDSAIKEAIFVPLTITAADMTDEVTTQDSSYYNFAVKNAAFRVWYFTDDSDGLITNWTADTTNSGRTLNANGLHNLYKGTTVHPLCSSRCGASTSSDCFQCIRENYAKPLCSRDNFSIRPEAFDIRIKDFPDLNVITGNTDLTRDVYGTAPNTVPTAARMSLAAGYKYRYDVNATGSEVNASAFVNVPLYTRYFNGINPDYNLTMAWDSNLTSTQCNDIAPLSFSFIIVNGALANQAEALNQVGDYRLNMIDKSWTAVDQVNHSTSDFVPGTDCQTFSNTTYYGVSNILQGCEISSQHTNGVLQYKDQPVVFKPAKFDLATITYGLGMTSAPIVAGGQGFVYMSDLANTNDMNMSVRSGGQIKAFGENNSTLTNFVGGCFARDITMRVDTNASFVGNPSFNGRMITSDIADTNRTDSGEVDLNSSLIGTITAANFHKIDNGSTLNTLRLNFDRNQTVPFDPQIVTYSDINVSCVNAVDCNHSSMRNSTPNIAMGTDAMDFNVTHVYGRVIARGERVIVNQPFDIQANYEVYRTPTLLGTPLVLDTFDADWRVNALHQTTMIYGDAVVTVIDPNPNASVWTPYPTSYYDNNGTEIYNFGGISTRQGYKGHIDTEGWLWTGITALPYLDPNGPAQAGTNNLDCLTHPCFDITFGRIVGNTGSAKTESEAQKANKKSSSTGWSTTYEYAPATR